MPSSPPPPRGALFDPPARGSPNSDEPLFLSQEWGVRSLHEEPFQGGLPRGVLVPWTRREVCDEGKLRFRGSAVASLGMTRVGVNGVVPRPAASKLRHGRRHLDHAWLGGYDWPRSGDDVIEAPDWRPT